MAGAIGIQPPSEALGLGAARGIETNPISRPPPALSSRRRRCRGGAARLHVNRPQIARAASLAGTAAAKAIQNRYESATRESNPLFAEKASPICGGAAVAVNLPLPPDPPTDLKRDGPGESANKPGTNRGSADSQRRRPARQAFRRAKAGRSADMVEARSTAACRRCASAGNGGQSADESGSNRLWPIRSRHSPRRQSIAEALRMQTIVAWAVVAPRLRMACGRSPR